MTKLNLKQVKNRLQEAIDAAEFKDRPAPKGSTETGDKHEVNATAKPLNTKLKKADSSIKGPDSIDSPEVKKWGVDKSKKINTGLTSANALRQGDMYKITGPFLKGLDPNKVKKITVKPSTFSVEPKAKFVSSEKMTNNGSGVFKPSAQKTVTEGVFNGRVEVRVGRKKHVFEAVTPASIRKVASSYAPVGQPVDINVFPGIRRAYLNENFAQKMTNSVHYNSMGLKEQFKTALAEAFTSFYNLLEGEYNPRIHSSKSFWKENVVKGAFKQAYGRFKDIYHENLNVFETSVRARKGKEVDVFETVSKGIDEHHAAILSMQEVAAEAGPSFVIESVTIGPNIYTKDDIIKHYSSTPKIVIESMDIDTAFVKGLIPTEDRGIKTSSKKSNVKDAPAPQKMKRKAGSAEGAGKVKTTDQSNWKETKPEKLGEGTKKKLAKAVNQINEWVAGKKKLDESRMDKNPVSKNRLLIKTIAESDMKSVKGLMETAKAIRPIIQSIGSAENLNRGGHEALSDFIKSAKRVSK